ncbi:MAG: response regulator [Elusimicrobiota bacterium]
MSDKKRVLIIEDDVTMNNLLKKVVEKEGYECVSAYNGLEAVNMAKTEKADLILLDLILPMGRGEVVYAQLKQLFATKDTPILIITAEDLDYLVEFVASRNIPEENVFTKPVNFEQLIARIKQLMPE